jgi:hypothetical protein
MPSPDTSVLLTAALLTAASVLIAPSAYRAEVSQLFVAPSCAIMASAVNSVRRSRGQPSFPEAAAPRSGRTPHRHSRLLSAPRGATSSIDDQPPRRLRTVRTRCFVPTRSNADSGSSYGTNRCELRRTPSVFELVNEPFEEDRASQYALSQLRAPSVARCRASFRGSVSRPRPTAADSVVRWTVVRRRPRVPWPPSPSLLAAQTVCQQHPR